MTDIDSIKPFLAVVVAAVAALLIARTRGNLKLRESWTIGAAVIQFLLIASMLPGVLKGNVYVFTVVEMLPGITIAFKADALGMLFALTAAFLWIVTSIYSMGYLRALNEHAQTRFYTCFAVTLSATIGVAFSANLLTLFLFYEIITMATYPLVSHKETPAGYEGGGKYIWYLVSTSKAFLLPAVILTFVLAGTLDFRPGGIFPADPVGTEATLLTVVFFLFIAGFAKAALIPFHSWLPSAMVAPTPVSALLHAVAVVKVGVFSIVKIVFFIFGAETAQNLGVGTVVVYLASFTILAASIIALTKDNLKARLAYSTISQLSYIVFGIAMLTPSGMIGGMVHIANHAFSKITLFFCAGSIYAASGKTNVSQLNGIARRMPWTMTAFAIGALSMIGMPLFAGFITKWYLAFGIVEGGNLPLLLVLGVSSILNGAYFLPVIYSAFFKKLPANEKPERKEAPPLMLVPLIISAAVTLLIFLYPSFFVGLAKLVLPPSVEGNLE